LFHVAGVLPGNACPQLRPARGHREMLGTLFVTHARVHAAKMHVNGQVVPNPPANIKPASTGRHQQEGREKKRLRPSATQHRHAITAKKRHARESREQTRRVWFASEMAANKAPSRRPAVKQRQTAHAAVTWQKEALQKNRELPAGQRCPRRSSVFARRHARRASASVIARPQRLFIPREEGKQRLVRGGEERSNLATQAGGNGAQASAKRMARTAGRQKARHVPRARQSCRGVHKPVHSAMWAVCTAQR